MSEPKWPIRVGGIYLPNVASRGTWEGCRVTAIDGSTVHYILRSRHDDDSISEHSPRYEDASIFRMIFLPEDQSPLPALIEALDKALVLLQEERLVIDTCSLPDPNAYEIALMEKYDDVINEVRAALALAKNDEELR